jgi:hypothetical protein
MCSHPSYEAVTTSHPILRDLFALSGHFEIDSLLSYFQAVYHEAFQFGNCKLIRRTIEVGCCYAISGCRMLFLSSAKWEDNNLVFTDLAGQTPFLEAVYLNEFGLYHLFLGRPILSLDLSSIIFSVGFENEISIDSCLFGCCTIIFEGGIPIEIPRVNINELK